MIKRNAKGQTLFSQFKHEVNKEGLDELDGFTFEIETTQGVWLPTEFIVDRENKVVRLKTEHAEGSYTTGPDEPSGEMERDEWSATTSNQRREI